MNHSYQPNHTAITPRSNPEIMLLPFFPESKGLAEYHARTGDMEVTVKFHPDPERDPAKEDTSAQAIATPEDRKLLNIVSGLLARQVRAGSTSHTVEVPLRELILSLDGDRGCAPGGEDYRRLRERLNRVKHTEVSISRRQPNGTWKTQEFWWITNVSYESTDKHIGRDTKSIWITLNSKAFDIMTKGLGYDTPHDEFLQITSNPTSTWRIYQICLATLIENDQQESMIPMQLLHDLIPLQCGLKAFKSRALRQAFDKISDHSLMGKHISLRLLKKTPDGFQEITFSNRVKLDEVYIGIKPGDLSDIKLTRLLNQTGEAAQM